jgi:hypothetical protein
MGNRNRRPRRVLSDLRVGSAGALELPADEPDAHAGLAAKGPCSATFAGGTLTSQPASDTAAKCSTNKLRNSGVCESEGYEFGVVSSYN